MKEGKMSSVSKTLIVPVTAILALLLMVAWFAGVFKEKIEPGVNEYLLNAMGETYVARYQTIEEWEPVPATIEAKQATNISSRILASIVDVKVRAGNVVKKSDLLIKLENADLQSRVSQSTSIVAAVTARLKEAIQNLDRAKELNDRKLLARSDLDKAIANHDALVADLSSARQALTESKTNLSFSFVRSPIDGVVVDRFAEPGDTVQPGQELLSIYNPLTLRVEANVREELALRLELGQLLKVSIPSLDIKLNAEIEEIVPAGNSGSRSFMVKSRLNFKEGLLPGMYAKMRVPGDTTRALVIPLSSMLNVGQLNVVWIDNKGTAERRFIRIGRQLENGLVEVISGLSEGEVLLLSDDANGV